ncbi:MAG: GtrA family protein [Pseudoxanthomonas sp.]
MSKGQLRMSRAALRGFMRGDFVRQAILYGVVGGAQLFLDYLCFVVLTKQGVAIVPANLIARVIGATLGYFLNRRVTFTDAVAAEHKEIAVMLRFAVVWTGLTIAGTTIVGMLGKVVVLEYVWLAKPLVDGFLAALGFLLSRFWIYK